MEEIHDLFRDSKKSTFKMMYKECKNRFHEKILKLKLQTTKKIILRAQIVLLSPAGLW